MQIELGLKNKKKSNVLSLSHIELGRHSRTFLFQPDIAEPGLFHFKYIVQI